MERQYNITNLAVVFIGAIVIFSLLDFASESQSQQSETPSSSVAIEQKPSYPAGNVLKVCGQRYINDRKKLEYNAYTWQSFLAECRAELEHRPEQLAALPPRTFNKSVPTNTKFRFGDVVCINGGEEPRMTINDIAPNKDGEYYVYHTKHFDTNHVLQREEHTEDTIHLCQ